MRSARSISASLFFIGVVTAIAIACGSSSDSTFVDPTLEAGSPPPADTFNTVDASGADSNAGCVPLTCATANADCGAIGDGCGGSIQCGSTCPVGQTCGGGGVTSKCGAPPCAKKTCADQGIECGKAGDGCGGLIADCGSCEAGICGGGVKSKCGGGGDSGACVPTKSLCAPGDCGFVEDGCGNVIDCTLPGCPAGEACGVGSPAVANRCGAPPCVKATCGALNCGYIASGCGGPAINCWPPGAAVCGPGQTCGGVGVPANTCGAAASCTGLCAQQQMCVGGATTSIEGYVTSPNGVLPVPNAVVYVPDGAVPAITANVKCETCAAPVAGLIKTTTDANGHFFLPNMPVSTPGKIVDIPVVVQLGRWRKQFTIVTTACTNTLVPSVGGAAANKTAALPAVQSATDNIPLTAISTGQVDGLECVFQKIGVADSEFTSGSGSGRIRLYVDNESNGSGGAAAPGCGTSGNVSGASFAAGAPIVITTSAAHGLATKMGVKITAVKGNTNANGTWTITVVDATHFTLDGSVGNAAYTSAGKWAAACPVADTLYCPAGTSGVGCTTACPAGGPCAVNEIDKFDATIFGCTGGEHDKPVTARNNVIQYANKGGRVFGTHFSYVWLYSTTTPAFASPWAGTANTFKGPAITWKALPVAGGRPGSLSAFLDTSFPKGVLFSTWLQAPFPPLSATFLPPYAPVDGLVAASPPRIALTEPRRNITPTAPNMSTSGIVPLITLPNPVPGGPPIDQALAQRWIYTTDDDGKACPAAPATCKSGVCSAGKCVGSVVYDPQTAGGVDPPAADAPMHYTFNTPTTAAPAAQCGRALFSDFHVSVGNTNGSVFPGECDGNPLTPQEKVLAYMLFDLASCVSSSAPPACVPKDCAAQGIGCGLAGDGCGGQIDCKGCPPGQSCGGGGVPSQCGAPVCNARVCKPPSAGPPAFAGDCGKMGNGCGGQIDCGNCAVGSTCGGGGPNICGALACNPQVCPAPAAGSACGPVADGCGAVNNCPCAAGVPCVNGLCGAPACNPRTCITAGANCGQVADGCGVLLDCGACVAPQTCGGGGTANLCGGGVN